MVVTESSQPWSLATSNTNTIGISGWQAALRHLIGSVYLNCCSMKSDGVWQSRHWNLPFISSGRTWFVRVTVPLMHCSFPTNWVLRSRTLSTWVMRDPVLHTHRRPQNHFSHNHAHTLHTYTHIPTNRSTSTSDWIIFSVNLATPCWPCHIDTTPQGGGGILTSGNWAGGGGWITRLGWWMGTWGSQTAVNFNGLLVVSWSQPSKGGVYDPRKNHGLFASILQKKITDFTKKNVFWNALCVPFWKIGTFLRHFKQGTLIG